MAKREVPRRLACFERRPSSSLVPRCKLIVGIDVSKDWLDLCASNAAAITLIADLPELGLLSAKQIAALVGLAPHTKRSGKTRYRETTGHRRPGVRRVLFNAARAAVRHPSLFKDFYDRLVTDNRRPGKSLPQRKQGSPSPPCCAKS